MIFSGVSKVPCGEILTATALKPYFRDRLAKGTVIPQRANACSRRASEPGRLFGSISRLITSLIYNWHCVCPGQPLLNIIFCSWSFFYLAWVINMLIQIHIIKAYSRATAARGFSINTLGSHSLSVNDGLAKILETSMLLNSWRLLVN